MDYDTKPRKQLLEELAALHSHRATVAEFGHAIHKLEDVLDSERWTLQERVKELNCLLAISAVMDTPGITLDQVLLETVHLIVPAWQFPDVTCARITCADLEAVTTDFVETAWTLASDLIANGQLLGAVEVYYREERSKSDEGPFLREERNLLDAIAGRIGRFIEHTWAEEALRSSQATTRALLDAPHDVLTALVDPQGRVLEANQAMTRWLGASRAEILGRRVWDFLGPETVADRQALLREVLTTGQPARFEVERNGTWFLGSVHPILDSEGEVLRVAIMAWDITERLQAEWERDSALALLEKAHAELEARIEERTSLLSDTVDLLRQEVADREHAERALSRTNRRLRMLIAASQALMRATDETDLLSEVCEIAVQVGGYRLAWIGYAQEDDDKSVRPVAQAGFEEGYLEGLNITWADTERGRGPTGTAIRARRPAIARQIHTDPAFAPWRNEATKRGYASSLALPLTSRGSTFGALNIYASEPDAFDSDEVDLLAQLANDLAFGVLAIRDRHRRHRAEDTLRRRVEELSGLYRLGRQMSGNQSVQDLVQIALDGVFDLVRPDLALLFLRDGSDLHLTGSRSAAARFKPKEPPVHRVDECLCGRAVREGVPIYTTQFHRDGHCTWEECRVAGVTSFAAVPLRSGRTVLGALALGSARERAFQQQSAFLETIADQVASAVNRAQLASEAAELEILRGLDTLRSELVANVSHEIRTPLGLIEVLTGSLLMQDIQLDAATQREFLEGIAQETQRLKAIVDNLLNLSQIEAGTLRPFLQTVDLCDLARARARSFQEQTTKHQLVVDLPSEPLLAQVDERQIDQVLGNLLSNALRYSPDGGTIRILGHREGQEIILSVADEGVGIPLKEQTRIFERFYRVDSDLTRRVSGVGLGLSVCKGIIESYGGSIWVESTPGQGSIFHFSLPAEQAP